MGGKADGAIFAYNFAFHASLYNVVRMYRHMQHFCNSGAPAVSVATNYDPFRDRKHRLTPFETQYGMKRFNVIEEDEEGVMQQMYEFLTNQLLRLSDVSILPPLARYPPQTSEPSSLDLVWYKRESHRAANVPCCRSHALALS